MRQANVAAAPDPKLKWVCLTDVCELKPPKSIPRGDLSDDDLVSFVPMGDLGELEKYFQAKDVRRFGEVVRGYTYFADGDLLCAKITPCFENGKLGIANGLKNGVGFGSSEFVVMRPKTELSVDYLYYFLARDDFREVGSRAMTGAVGHKRVPKEYFEQLFVPLPPLSEQKRIVAILDQAFAALDRARTNAEANLADANSMFDACISAIFDSVAKSETKGTLSEITCAIVDCEHKTAPTADSGYPSIRTPNVGKGVLKLEGVRRVSEETYQQWTRRAVPEPGDLIMAREAPAGNVAVIPDGETVCLGQRTLLIKPNKESTEPSFLAHLLLHPEMQRRLLEKSAGATVQHVNMKDIRALPMPALPPMSEQIQISRQIRDIRILTDRLVGAAQEKFKDIAALRQSLLQQAFFGQLTRWSSTNPGFKKPSSVIRSNLILDEQ